MRKLILGVRKGRRSRASRTGPPGSFQATFDRSWLGLGVTKRACFLFLQTGVQCIYVTHGTGTAKSRRASSTRKRRLPTSPRSSHGGSKPRTRPCDPGWSSSSCHSYIFILADEVFKGASGSSCTCRPTRSERASPTLGSRPSRTGKTPWTSSPTFSAASGSMQRGKLRNRLARSPTSVRFSSLPRCEREQC